MLQGQPKGLYALALANTGERFGYYTMLAIFTLFLQAKFLEKQNIHLQTIRPLRHQRFSLAS